MATEEQIRAGREKALAARRQPAPSAAATGGISGPAATFDYDVTSNSVEDVESWVGEDAAKARYALEQERAGKNRKTLVERLSELAG